MRESGPIVYIEARQPWDRSSGHPGEVHNLVGNAVKAIVGNSDLWVLAGPRSRLLRYPLVLGAKSGLVPRLSDSAHVVTGLSEGYPKPSRERHVGCNDHGVPLRFCKHGSLIVERRRHPFRGGENLECERVNQWKHEEKTEGAREEPKGVRHENLSYLDNDLVQCD
jgi:hypothetical protein